ncbi:MAG: hypothetical protein LBS19_00430 [Clostridiales bacterium]|jgi:hypothetical protein|nr:hypothetical protein [Clostridiales bacterium]
MSWFEFLASDIPMDDLENARALRLSVGEAVKRGLNAPDTVLRAADIESPEAFLWFEKREDLYEIEIKEMLPFMRTNGKDVFPVVDLLHFSSLNWEYTDERARQLIEYVRTHLEKAGVVELWGYWAGMDTDRSKSRRREIRVDALTPEYLASVCIESPYDYDCIVILP